MRVVWHLPAAWLREWKDSELRILATASDQFTQCNYFISYKCNGYNVFVYRTPTWQYIYRMYTFIISLAASQCNYNALVYHDIIIIFLSLWSCNWKSHPVWVFSLTFLYFLPRSFLFSHVPFFQIVYSSIAIILESASSFLYHSCCSLARCIISECTPRLCDPFFLHSELVTKYMHCI